MRAAGSRMRSKRTNSRSATWTARDRVEPSPLRSVTELDCAQECLRIGQVHAESESKLREDRIVDAAALGL